jgi:chromosome segregation ATPase
MKGSELMEDGVWRTVGGRRIFIKEGQSLSDAMRNSGKFEEKDVKTKLKKQFDKNKEKQSDNQEKIEKLEKELEEAKGFLERGKIREKIEALKENKTVEQYRKDKEEKRIVALKEREEKEKQLKEQKIKEIEQRRKQLEEDIKNAPKEKLEQYEIIKENNPMLDDYHVGIRSPKDIKSFNEVINDDESFSWGDFSKKDAEKALQKGEITIYSSYSIEQGTFVSTSKIQAEQYAGGKKVYTKTVSVNDVAWINGDEGQFAKVKK